MPEIVTPGEMAETLRISPKTLRAWMRAGRDAGHPLLSGHEHYGRWEFNRADADALIAEYRTGRRPAATGAQALAATARRPRNTPAAPTPPATRAAAPSATAAPAGDAPRLPAAFTRDGLTAVGFKGWLT